MSSLTVTAKAIPVAITGWIASANASALGGLAERKDVPNQKAYRQVLTDEGLEHLWQFLGSSISANIGKEFLPSIPEQLIIIPGKLFGAIWHWLIASGQSLNRGSNNENEIQSNNNSENIFSQFHEKVIKGPSDFLLDLVGLGENSNMTVFGISQLATFGIAGYLSSKDDSENLPGLNLDSNESISSNIAKAIGYTAVEYVTTTTSQIARFYIDCKEQFGEQRFVKSIANVINEKIVPGHSLSAIVGAISTYTLGNIIPKSSAAALGEFTMKFFNRLPNAHKRRATKQVINEDGKIIDNHKNSARTVKMFDSLFDPIRNSMLRNLSRVSGVSEKELKESFTPPKENLILSA